MILRVGVVICVVSIAVHYRILQSLGRQSGDLCRTALRMAKSTQHPCRHAQRRRISILASE
jgi:hypothetical protein